MAEIDPNELRFSAKFDHGLGSAGPPTQSPVGGVRDVILCVRGEEEIADGEWRAHPPVGALDWTHGHWGEPDLRVSAVELGRDVRIARLDSKEAEMVQTACQPRGHYFFPIGAPRQVYAFVRSMPASELDENPYGWDPDGVLDDALMLSRLVRDNGYSKQYAARIVDHEDGEQQVVFLGWAEDAVIWRLNRHREYLDGPEAAELAGLLAAYWDIDSMPERVNRAMWRMSYTPRLRWADLVLSFVVSGLEALLSVEESKVSRQFSRRGAALAEELGIDDIDRTFCGRMYNARSEWIHGSRVSLFAPATPGAHEGGAAGPGDSDERDKLAEVALLQDLLRKAVRRCIEDDAFRAVFDDDAAIRERWPG